MHNTQGQSPRSPPLNRISSTLPRRLFVILLLSLGVYVLLPRLVGVPGTLSAIRQARILPLLAAASCQVASCLSLAYAVHGMLLGLGPGVGFVNVLQVTLASGFASMFLPSLGLSGMAVRARYWREHGYAVETTFLVGTLETLGQGAAHTILLALALLRQQLAGQTAPWRLLPMLLSVILLGSAALALVLSSPRSWRDILLRPLNYLRKHWGRAPTSALALEQRLSNLRRALVALPRPAKVSLLLGSLLRNVANALCLHWTLLAYGQRVPLQQSFISWTVSDFLGALSTLPGGLLVTDTSLSALLAGVGVTLSTAVTVTLTFRLIALWLPRAIGIVAWYILQRRSPEPLW